MQHVLLAYEVTDIALHLWLKHLGLLLESQQYLNKRAKSPGHVHHVVMLLGIQAWK